MSLMSPSSPVLNVDHTAGLNRHQHTLPHSAPLKITFGQQRVPSLLRRVKLRAVTVLLDHGTSGAPDVAVGDQL